MDRMNDEQLKVFKQVIYEPYLKAWEIMSSLSKMDLDKQETWDAWMNKCEEFYQKYPSTYAHSIFRVMLDAGDITKGIWNENKL